MGGTFNNASASGSILIAIVIAILIAILIATCLPPEWGADWGGGGYLSQGERLWQHLEEGASILIASNCHVMKAAVTFDNASASGSTLRKVRDTNLT